MEALIIQPTKKTPGIHLNGDRLLFSGRAIDNDPKSFFKPVFMWVSNYLEDPAETVSVIIKLNYINAAYVQTLLEVLKSLKEVENRGKSMKVYWHYVYGDLEMLQLGVLLQSRLDMEFEYNEFEQDEDISDAFSFA